MILGWLPDSASYVDRAEGLQETEIQLRCDIEWPSLQPADSHYPVKHQGQCIDTEAILPPGMVPVIWLCK